MPYIQDSIRRRWLRGSVVQPQDAGELNFVISTVVDRFLTRKGLTYANLNEALGAVECAKLEIYRRIAAPYEDTKIKENGDVFTTVPGQWTGGPTASP